MTSSASSWGTLAIDKDFYGLVLPGDINGWMPSWDADARVISWSKAGVANGVAMKRLDEPLPPAPTDANTSTIGWWHIAQSDDETSPEHFTYMLDFGAQSLRCSAVTRPGTASQPGALLADLRDLLKICESAHTQASPAELQVKGATSAQ
jgi:hypothetical protein